jgi:hypothetical protein
MSIQITGALRDHLLVTDSLTGALTGMIIRIYGGTVPSLPEDSISGNTLLCTISNNKTGTGLEFEATAYNGLLTKKGAQVWAGDCATDGTATFYRLSGTGDTGGLSLSEKRVQGTVGSAGADLNVTSVSFIEDEEKRIDYYSIGMLVG